MNKYWRDIYEEVFPKADARLARKGVKDPQERFDFIQDAFLYAYEHPELRIQLEDNKEAAITYILWKTWKLFLSFKRRERRFTVNTDFVPATGSDTDNFESLEILDYLGITKGTLTQREIYERSDPSVTYEQFDQLKRAMDKMTRSERIAYEYRIQGYTTKLIAAKMETTVGAVQKLLQRGKAAGRKI
jgi:DNA-directed RNA polymerase specialized sigma24 family protein